MKHESQRRPRKCPECGSQRIATILYGFPDFEAIKDDLESGRIILGGCCISDTDPAWQCLACETVVFRGKK
jgi:hypothetical protein